MMWTNKNVEVNEILLQIFFTTLLLSLYELINKKKTNDIKRTRKKSLKEIESLKYLMHEKRKQKNETRPGTSF